MSEGPSLKLSPVRELAELGISAVLGSDRAGTAEATPARVLTAAAVAGTRVRAGRRFGGAGQEIAACPVEMRAMATAPQRATLERLLIKPDAALIEEWCGLARERGVRVPEVAVPALLEWWARQLSRSASVFDATGTCGAWLAGLNPDWHKPVAVAAIPADADELWQSGTVAERAALLLTVRQNDAPRALQLVRTTWGVDGAEERRRFVEVLREGVTAADEEFLEAALDDRSKVVRREAARVLTGLAGSGLRRRMGERAAAMLVVEKAKGGLMGMLGRGKMKLKVEPPKEFDKAWQRDGVEEQASAGKGKRAFWLAQVLAAADLAVWTGLSGQTPEVLIEAISGDEYFNDVLGAMIASVAACPGQADAAAWGDALVARCADHGCAHNQRMSDLWVAQTVERSEAMRLRFAGGKKAGKGAEVWQVLTSDSRAWSLEFSNRAVKVLAEVTPKKTDSWQMWQVVAEVAALLHPGAAEAFEKLIAELYPDGPGESMTKSVDRVRLRAEMHREFFA